MRNTIKNFLLAAFIILAAISCDKVEPPFMNDLNIADTTVCPVPEFGTFTPVRKILLEEFTGHKCPNCPQGAAIAADLAVQYSGRLVIAAIHAGYFATADAAGSFTANYTTTEGEDIADNFGVILNPVGMVNRKAYNGSVVLNPGDWGNVIQDLESAAPDIYIQIKPVAAADNSNSICIHVKTHFLNNMSGTYHLVVQITENNIVSPQKTNDPAYPGGVIDDYTHKHIYRTAVNGAWGMPIASGNVEAGSSVVSSYKLLPDAAWVLANCNIVAFVYDDNDEVIQVEETVLIP